MLMYSYFIDYPNSPSRDEASRAFFASSKAVAWLRLGFSGQLRKMGGPKYKVGAERKFFYICTYVHM